MTAIAHGAKHDKNIIVQVKYDKAGRVTEQRDPRGNLTTYTYDQLNRRMTLTNPLDQTWTTGYIEGGSGSTYTQITYPGLGSETYVVEREFDALGRLRNINYGDHATTPQVAFTYDSAGNRTSMSESGLYGVKLRETHYSYDDARRLTSVGFDENGDGVIEQSVSYEYDAGGRRTRLTMSGELSISYDYDEKGQLVGLTDWDGHKTQFAHDKLGRTTAAIRANGFRSRYTYDAGGRLRRLRHTQGAQTLAEFAYEVDRRGNRTQTRELLVHPATISDITLSYDDPAIEYHGTWTDAAPFKQTVSKYASLKLLFFGSVATFTLGTGADHGMVDVYVGHSLWQTFDSYAAQDGERVITLALTSEGPHLLELRNRSVKNAASSGFKLRFKGLTTEDVAYDLHTIRYTYDALSRVARADYHPGGNLNAAPFRQYGYSFDVAGNRTQQVITIAGTPTTTNYTYNAANQLIGDGTHTLTYDPNGNMTSDGVRSYLWDHANRLIQVGYGIDTYWQYTYDGLGNRVKQHDWEEGNYTKYLLDVQPGLAVVLSATTGTDVTRYVHSPQGIHAQKDSVGDWRWMVNDGLRSVRMVVGDDLSVLESRLLDPYGNKISVTGTPQTVYHFTGEPRDLNGLQYHRARYYNPALGVFPSLDPFEGAMNRPMSLNGYGWVEGNSSNGTDPAGLQYGNPAAMPLNEFVQFVEVGGAAALASLCVGPQAAACAAAAGVALAAVGVYALYNLLVNADWDAYRAYEAAIASANEGRYPPVPTATPGAPPITRPDAHPDTREDENPWGDPIWQRPQTPPEPPQGPDWSELVSRVIETGIGLLRLLQSLNCSQSQSQPTQPQATPESDCPAGSHRIVWPFPVWTTAGHGDTGATSGVNDYPPRIITKRASPPRGSAVQQYISANQEMYDNLGGSNVIRVHHKWPLFLSGPDISSNLVFLTINEHNQWHTLLYRQGVTGYMPLDQDGTVYCVT